ncbi:MAG: lysine exporter LysO family protein [Rikenellaceae bacterium]
MKGSLLIVGLFLAGLLLGRSQLDLSFLDDDSLASWVLYGLMFLVGISIGSDTSTLRSVFGSKAKIFLVPLATILGTLIAVALLGVLWSGRPLWDYLAVGSGFGYYSLSSIFITEYRGIELGAVALTTNIVREIITLLFAPWLVRWFSPLAPITAGGATTMDTTLPVITQFSGKEWVVVAITHGAIVDLSVPFLVTLFCTL